MDDELSLKELLTKGIIVFYVILSVVESMTRLFKFQRLAYDSPEEVKFGFSKKPLRYGFDISVGSGKVVPEIKYFPKPADLKDEKSALLSYKRLTERILMRAISLGVPSVQLETELPHIITLNPKLAGDVTALQKDILKAYFDEYGVKLALRVTVADVRDFSDPDKKEERTNTMLETFEVVSEQGADVISIESFGGKEVVSQALIRCDIEGLIFATGVLGSRDVEELWSDIRRSIHGSTLLGGDSACAHANSAMVLANGLRRRMIPHIIASIERVLGAVRTLACFESGAQGPGKDCAYENVYMKIITGIPVSMEGKSSACAHSSLVGNIVASICDLWSNESVEDLRLFGGGAPEVFLEILHYDCEVLNTSIKLGFDKTLREVLIASDKYRDPQGLVLAPEIAFEIAKTIVSFDSYYERSVESAKKTCELLKLYKDHLKLPRVEAKYLERVSKVINEMPNEHKFIDIMVKKYKKLCPSFNPKSYGI